MPKVSIIIPVYNVEKYLSRSLASLVNQTLTDIEIICVDDCSPDNSKKILGTYSKNDNRINVISLDQNYGAAVARNKGLDVATGEYIGFVDPDDIVDLDFYEKLYNKAKETDYDIVKGGCKTYQQNGTLNISKVNEYIKAKGKLYFKWEFWSAIYRKSLIKNNNIKFPEECRKAQDIVFLNRAVLCSKNLSLVNNVFYNYFRRPDSLDSANLSLDKIKSVIIANKLIFKDYNNSDLYKNDKNLYLDLYKMKYNDLLKQSLRTDSLAGKQESARAIIECFYMCKDTNWLEKNFTFKNLLKFIKTKNVEELTKVLYKSSTLKELFYYGESLKDKIFSLKEASDETHKIINVLGIKLKIRRKQK